MAGANSPLKPTFTGIVNTTLDALILFEACLSGHLTHVPRRPHDRERGDLIKSGNVFIYEEHASGIKRWTDGVSWSPSRILQNFLIYRELDKPFPPGEKKRALKKKASNSNNRPGSNGIVKAESSSHRTPPTASESSAASQNMNRALVGSLVDSYQFRDGGLVKKTISINYQGVNHHLVSYYTVTDAENGYLITPSQHPGLQHVTPRHELTSMQNFRANWEDCELSDRRLVLAFAQPQQVAHPSGEYMTASNGAGLQQAMGVGGYTHSQMPQHMAPQHMPNYGLVATPSTSMPMQMQGHQQQQYYHPAPPPTQPSPMADPLGSNNNWVYTMDGAWRNA